jgi:hypothetical protein
MFKSCRTIIYWFGSSDSLWYQGSTVKHSKDLSCFVHTGSSTLSLETSACILITYIWYFIIQYSKS